MNWLQILCFVEHTGGTQFLGEVALKTVGRQNVNIREIKISIPQKSE
jgi:hypothetical protein